MTKKGKAEGSASSSSGFRSEPATAPLHSTQTDVGSVFVSNYPPYSYWNSEPLESLSQALRRPPQRGRTLGLYLHIPFCRKRCKFCYFKVYTDKNASDIERYLAALTREVELYADAPAIQARPLDFVYFGGGTPSYISSKHLRRSAEKLQRILPWTAAREVTFECEPGTLSQSKLEAIRRIGTTRISLGVENFDDGILKENGRAHLSQDIHRCLPWIRDLGFEQLNIDLIAGMIGETWETWKGSVEQTIEISPDSVTIYQLELPFNTVYSSDVLSGKPVQVAGWELKREWHRYALERLRENGYEALSAYTMVKRGSGQRFLYSDSVWSGGEMIGAGVASFGHLCGIHVQNTPSWESYNSQLEAGRLPWNRAYRPDSEELFLREAILKLKKGGLERAYFQSRHDKDILVSLEGPLQRLSAEGMLTTGEEGVELTPEGMLQVDHLLPEFYLERHRGGRYT